MIIETVQNPTQGLKSAKRLLYKHVDQKTALFLSGGSTPQQLYITLAQEKKINPGAVAMVDERYGLPFDSNSNERMIRETVLLDYFEKSKIPFYSILRHPASINQTTEKYKKVVQDLFLRFQKHVAVLGIGEDGHIAGLPAKTQNSPPKADQPLAEKLKTQNYVIGLRDFPGKFRERITLTFNALSKMDLLIVLVFGSAKRKALNFMLTDGSIEEIPARFFNRPDIAKKTILITDQKVYNNY